MDDKLKAFMERLKQAKHFGPVLTDVLVARGEDLQWLGPEQTGNFSKIALYLDLPTRTFEIFLQEIPPGGSSDMQRHHHESVHFVIEGRGYSEIEGRRVEWGPNDCIYTPPWTWHRHYNLDPQRPVRMLGIENSRLLDAIGPINRRESAGMKTWAELRSEAE